MANALVSKENVNVIIVDWRGGSLPMYSQAAANTRLKKTFSRFHSSKKSEIVSH